MPSLIEPKLRVAICGGGIGGLMLACALSRAQDIALDVYEGAAAFGDIGAGITLRKRTMPFLADLGLIDEITAINGSSGNTSGTGMTFYRADNGELETITDIPGQGMVTLHRAEFHNIIFRHIASHVRMHTTKRLISYTDPGDVNSPVRLVFADGTDATCDILIGADGVKSAVRATMLNELASRMDDEIEAEELRESIPPRFSGASTLRAVIPKEKLAAISSDSSVWTAGNLYSGNGLAFVTYPISQGRLLNVAVMTFNYALEDSLYPQPWVLSTKTDELTPLVEGWAPEIRHVVACLDGVEVKKWVINVVRPLADWTVGRVALLGDAAHAMTPFQGAGAVQAIEDAQVLSKLLAHPCTTRATVQQALRVYTDVRRPVARKFFDASRRNGQLISDPTILPHECGAEMTRVMDEVWNRLDSPAMNAQRAADLFEQALRDV
ncbi:FAD/NAD(P)-binding domain-containing protein [Peniophora sp. CONT]|nr:FAD/NAD(P)-binding domain-containing protein [Peniophora sp. CONT]